MSKPYWRMNSDATSLDWKWSLVKRINYVLSVIWKLKLIALVEGYCIIHSFVSTLTLVSIEFPMSKQWIDIKSYQNVHAKKRQPKMLLNFALGGILRLYYTTILMHLEAKLFLCSWRENIIVQNKQVAWNICARQRS